MQFTFENRPYRPAAAEIAESDILLRRLFGPVFLESKAHTYSRGRRVIRYCRRDDIVINYYDAR